MVENFFIVDNFVNKLWKSIVSLWKTSNKMWKTHIEIVENFTFDLFRGGVWD